MQKISTYLYPNRIQLLADLAGFNVEYTNVYQRTVNIYKGINNTLEFEFKNADQKRIDISPYTLTFTVMDNSGNQVLQETVTQADTTLNGISISRTGGLATVTLDKDYGLATGDLVSFTLSGGLSSFSVSNAPITVVDYTTFTYTNAGANVSTTSTTNAIDCVPAYLKGIGRTTILSTALTNLDPQTFRYSVADLTNNVLFYGDTRFGASGTCQLFDNALPAVRKSRVFSKFYADLSYSSLINEYFHSDSIPVRYYEAVPTDTATLTFVFANLQGTVFIEGTKDSSISTESWPNNGNPTTNPDGTPAAYRRGVVIDQFNVSTTDVSATKSYTGLSQYTYIRVTYLRSSVPVNGAWMPGTGTVSKITVTAP